MERLNVKSLNGIDLAEALATLRRQSSAFNDASAPLAQQIRATAIPPSAAPPHYFEEEDSEFDVTFSLDGDLLADDMSTAAGQIVASAPYERDGFDLEDVPDFDAAPVPGAHPPREGQMPAGSSANDMVEAPGGTRVPRAVQIINQLRATARGGAPTGQQRNAYRNIILDELGELAAKTLVTSLWRVPAERLGSEQLDALLSWGKQDTFGDEAPLVLEALRAESERVARPPQALRRPPGHSAPSGGK